MAHSINIFLHVFAGIIAIVFGVIAYCTVNRGTQHRRVGRWFLYCTAVVVLTAALGVLCFVDRPFLTVVTLQTGYFAWTGWRAVRRKSAPPTRTDLVVTLLAVGIVARFFWLLNDANLVWNRSVIAYLLLYLLAVLLFDLGRHLFGYLGRHPRFWLYDHIFRMTGTFTGLASAGAGTILAAYEPWSQIIPAGVSTVWLVVAVWWLPRQVTIEAANSKASAQPDYLTIVSK